MIGVSAFGILVNIYFQWMDGKYYPMVFFICPPSLFAGLVGLFVPRTFEEIERLGKSSRQLEVNAVFFAFCFGLLVGGYLLYDPEVFIRWLGLN